MTGLYIEGARWCTIHNSLTSIPSNSLSQSLPILSILPLEEHRLNLQVLILKLSLFSYIYRGPKKYFTLSRSSYKRILFCVAVFESLVGISNPVAFITKTIDLLAVG